MNQTLLRIVQEAYRRLESGDREGARQMLTAAVRQNPREAQLWYWMARSLDNREHAIDAAQRALRIDPSLREAQQYLRELQEPREQDFSLDWLEEERDPSGATPTTTPSTPQHEPEPFRAEEWQFRETSAPQPPSEEESAEDEWSFLAEITGDLPQDDSPAPGRVDANEPEPAVGSEASGWSFLEEIGGVETPPVETVRPSAPEASPADEAPGWTFLDELETAPPTVPLSPPPAAQSHDEWGTNYVAPTAQTQVTEESLWARAEPFIGPYDDHYQSSAIDGDSSYSPGTTLPLPAAAPAAVLTPERGAFSFMDAPPSPAAALPVRGSFMPLSREALLEADVSGKGGRAKKGKRNESEKSVAAEQSPRDRRAARAKDGEGSPLQRLLSMLIVAVVFGGLCWFVLASLPPSVYQRVSDTNPQVARAVSAVQERVAPAPTALPSAAWVQDGVSARFRNEFTTAEETLRNGLATEPDNAAGLSALSLLLRDQPGGGQESLALAEQALLAVRTLEERALAVETFAWASATSAQPDLGRLRAGAEQAIEETPRSPHGHWALAVAAALEGNSELMEQSAQNARSLTPQAGGALGEAKLAELYAMIGQGEQAAQDYINALSQQDYVPWRVELVRLLRELQRPSDAQFHLEHLQRIAPDHPAVIELGQP